MGWSLEQLGRRMTSREYSLWQAYDQVEPIGELGAWWRTGVAAAAAANSGFNRRKRGHRPIEFMPILEGRPVQSPEEQRAVMETVAAYVRARQTKRKS